MLNDLLIRTKQNANILTVAIFHPNKGIRYQDGNMGPSLHCLTGPAVRYFTVGYLVDPEGNPASGKETVYYPNFVQMKNQVIYPLPRLDHYFLNGTFIPDGKDLINASLTEDDIAALILQAEMSAEYQSDTGYNGSPQDPLSMIFHLYSTSETLFTASPTTGVIRGGRDRFVPVLYRLGDCVDPKYLP